MIEREQRRRFERVLVATDFSTHATHALARALLLPFDARTRILVVHFVAYEGSAAAEARALEGGWRDLEGELAGVAFGGAHPVIVSEVLAGNPAVELVRRARAFDADLIVVGRHGKRRAALRHVLGHTAARAVRFGECPVLLVSRRPEGPYRHPLLATDLEDAPHRLVRLAAAILPDEVRRLRAIHAFSTDVADGPTNVDRRVALHRMHRFIESDHAPLAIAPSVRAGGAGKIILDEARTDAADLLVIGSYRQSHVTRAMLGSVTEYVMANAECDVLVGRSLHRLPAERELSGSSPAR